MFADRLSALRLKMNLTQQDMADKLQISRSSYTAYEIGKRRPDFDRLDQIANILDTSTDYLLGRTDISTPDTKINPEEQAQFEAFINNPEHGTFIKEYLEAPEERKKELIRAWRILKAAEIGFKVLDSQDAD